MRIEWVEWSHLFNFRSIQDLPEKHPETAKLTVQNAEKIAGLVHGAVFCAQMISF